MNYVVDDGSYCLMTARVIFHFSIPCLFFFFLLIPWWSFFHCYSRPVKILLRLRSAGMEGYRGGKPRINTNAQNLFKSIHRVISLIKMFP